MIKNWTFLFLILLYSNLLVAQTENYTGYRVFLAKIEELSQNDKFIKLAVQPVNTGRQDLQFGATTDQLKEKLVVNFSSAFKKGNLFDYKQAIINALLNENLQILSGAIGPKRELKIPLNRDITTADSEKETTNPEPIFDPNNCPDLRIEAIKVVKQSKNAVTIEYTIKNIGTGPANLEGISKKEKDNIAVKAYMTSSSKLVKGALILGGDFVKNRKNKGDLMPNETYTTTIKLDTNEMTKFTPIVILELDTFGQIQECDETNNLNHIKVR